MQNNIILSQLSVEQLVDLLTSRFTKIIQESKAEELQDKLLSPEETCRLFVPSISIATLNNYAKEGLLKKHYLGRLTFYKYSEIIEALKTVKKYSRRELSHQ